MSELMIIRASAGSGKTWRLTLEYLRLLFMYPDNHRHILAVTFTNKATEEMKNRIIQELALIASGKETKIGQLLGETMKLNQEQLIEKAKEILSAILHDFSRFTITTIDSFFQRILKVFARETGLPVMASLELQSEKILSETVDHLFFSLDSYPLLRDWLVEMSLSQVEEGRGWDIRDDIRKLGREILKENFPLKTARDEEHRRQDQKEFYHELSHARKKLLEELNQDAEDVEKLLSEKGLEISDFHQKSRGPMNFFSKLRDPESIEINQSIIVAKDSSEAWIPKDSKKGVLLLELVKNYFRPLLKKDIEILRKLNSINPVFRFYHVWGILDDLVELMRERTIQNNIYLLSDTPKVLSALIGNNDTPFIYERAGNTWNHIMIDEFQDTSLLQWNNFVPLLDNSLGGGFTGILVGDVKQSIYRWRNGDWRILAYRAAETFANRTNNLSLEINYRSSREIIEFNNQFFSLASRILQEKTEVELSSSTTGRTDIPHLAGMLRDAYEGCRQEFSPATPVGGWVEILNYSPVEDTNPEFGLVAETIQKLLSDGYHQRDLVILLREKKYGRDLAAFLTNRRFLPPEFPVIEIISGESLFLVNSPAIMVLISALRFLDSPDDEINRMLLASEYFTYLGSLSENGNYPFDGYLSEEELLAMLPESFTHGLKDMKSMPAAQACENIIRSLNISNNDEQTPYIDAFLDEVHRLALLQLNDTHSFLEWWKEEGENLALEVPEDQDAIRMMTIHKAKGLEFPVVIFPDPSWSLDPGSKHREILWCSTNDPLLGKNGPVPVPYSSKLKNTIFESHYYQEKIQSYVDQLNLLYVAFTRAEKGMYIFLPEQKKVGNLVSTSDLIQTSIELMHTAFSITNAEDGTRRYVAGYYSRNDLKVKEENFSINLPSPVKTGEITINLRHKADEYFNAGEDEKISRIQKGLIYHQLFEQIKIMEDMPGAVSQLVYQGLINSDDAENIRNFLHDQFRDPEIASWFSNTWTLKNECEILIPGGVSRRPDRIMFQTDRTLVIDYKFGNAVLEVHRKQMKEYLSLLEQAGFPEPRGVIWYVTAGLKEYENAG